MEWPELELGPKWDASWAGGDKLCKIPMLTPPVFLFSSRAIPGEVHKTNSTSQFAQGFPGFHRESIAFQELLSRGCFITKRCDVNSDASVVLKDANIWRLICLHRDDPTGWFVIVLSIFS